MGRLFLIFSFLILSGSWHAQLFVARDTINVIENGYILKMPWANGINFSNVSNADLNLDGKKDIVVFDMMNTFGQGRFRCFINTGVMVGGQTTYSANPDMSYYFPQVANWALFIDYNCDGKEDIFCSTSAGIKVFANKSYTNVGAPATLSFSLVKPLIYSNQLGGPANLYAATNSPPGISDIDGDGDLDILTLAPGGITIQYHENISTNCDSLHFQLNTGCWGKIAENGCGFSLNEVCNPKPFPGNNINANNNNRHSGSCLTCIDTDGDSDKDLLMGDIGCPGNLLYAHNGGTSSNALITATTDVYPNYPNIGNTLQIKFNNFSCAYSVDVDGDLKNDLVATPNVPGSENFQSLWYYKNTSATSTVNFQFVKKNLFQDEMIEVGQNSFPVLFDYNADNLKDLLIGTYGYYVGNSLQSRLALYKNIGTAAQPSYSLITKDYAGMSTFSLNTIVPTVGDIDGDGDTDILLGTQSGQVHWLKNTAGPGAVCTFTYLSNPFTFTTPSAAAAPQLFDIDNDLDLDLMIGGKNGRIQYYQNIGNVTTPSYTLTSAFFGSLSVTTQTNLFPFDGYAAPFFYKEGANTKLLVGSLSGQVFYYSVLSSTTPCVLINPKANGFNEGVQSTVFFEDVNADGIRDLFIGNAAGGLSFFSSMGPDVGMSEINETGNSLISVYPNPAQQLLNIRIDKIEVDKGSVTVIDILGKEVFSKKFSSNFESINITELKPGIYFVKINASNLTRTVSVTKKIIKE